MMEYHKDNNSNNSHFYHPSCYYCNQEDDFLQYSFGEDAMNRISFENEEMKQEIKPFKYNYLLNLMTAPDMNAYLSSIIINHDDIYNLPIHLQKLIIEAKEEILLLKNENRAQKKLEKLKYSIIQRSNGDFSNLMNTLLELVTDEDELEDLLIM